MTVARSGSNWIAFAVGLIVLGLTTFFYKPLTRKLGVPRLVITVFFLLLCVAAALYNLKVTGLIGNVLWRTGMYGVLTLAMLPGIQSGISLNMGMTIGIISGLLSTLIAMEINLVGWSAFLFAIGVGVLFAVPVGLLYGMLLNRLKGSEMTVSTYVGFSYVSLMSIAWMLLPFYNTRLTWALGRGLRVMHNMSSSFGKILDNFLAFELFGVRVPTGLLLFLFFACFLMWLFSRSKAGTAMIAAGNNPRFTEASGIKVDRMRLLGTTLSTVIAAVGIIVYSQSFGFMQLYAGPRQMGFVAASAILIGGASVTRAKVSNVILGTFLFQGVLSIGIQVANEAIEVGGLSEVMRILISNGIILYALTQSGGDSRD
ncbi:MAG: ABC transporter permease [Clostridiales bacterium]|nr:ABC transporter permease [Clostridiales bacterium]